MSRVSKSSAAKPFANVTKAKHALPAEAYDAIPRAQLTFTDETIWLSRFDPHGAPISTYPVNPLHVARSFAGVPASSGILPLNTVFWEYRDNAQRLGVYLPPARRTIHVQITKRREALTVALPAFLFVGEGKNYSIFALAGPSTVIRPSTVLYKAPLPNVYESGSICAGSVQFPVAAPATIHDAVNLFFESLFNTHVAENQIGGKLDLLAFLRRLHKKHARKFPYRHLVECGKLSDLVNDSLPARGNPMDDIEDMETDPEGALADDADFDADGEFIGWNE